MWNRIHTYLGSIRFNVYDFIAAELIGMSLVSSQLYYLVPIAVLLPLSIFSKGET